MQQNTLSTTLSFGGGEGGGDGVLQDLEMAGRLVDKHLNYDSSFPSLLDMLRVSPQGMFVYTLEHLFVNIGLLFLFIYF